MIRNAPSMHGALAAARRAGTLVLLFASVLSGCMSPSASKRLVVTPNTVLLPVPTVRQEQIDECGLASLDALCGYYDVELPLESRAELARIAREKEGISGGELYDLLRGLGWDTFLFQGTLDWTVTGLFHQIDGGRPPLVMISRDRKSAHACLFTGYDPTTLSVYLLDPRRGHLRMETSTFSTLWENADRFTLLALPPEEEKNPTPDAPLMAGALPEDPR